MGFTRLFADNSVWISKGEVWIPFKAAVHLTKPKFYGRKKESNKN